MSETFQTDENPKWRNWLAWGAQGLLALAFVAAGGQKLASTDAMVAMFADIGMGQWFRWITGLLEITAAGLLIYRPYSFYGALLVMCVMVGAVLTHVLIIGGTAIPALVLFCLGATVAWLRRPE